MKRRLSGKAIDVSDVSPQNANSSIERNEEGRLTLARLIQLPKAIGPMALTPSLTVTDCKLKQSLKALSGTVSTPEGMTMGEERAESKLKQ